MFHQIEAPRPRPGIIWIFQTFFVLVIAEFTALVMVWLSSDFPRPLPDILPGGVVGYPVRETIAIIGVGAVLGVLVGKLWPSLMTTGRWVWVLPFGLFSLTFPRDLIALSKYENVFSLYFTGIGGDEHGRLILGTYPMYAGVSYSAAMRLFNWRR